MKKTLKIARYDYKRIMTNPITLVVMCLIIAITFVFGLVFKPQTTPAYSASISGDTTGQVYENFYGTKDSDTKIKLEQIVAKAQKYINTQNECFDQRDLDNINQQFQSIKLEVEKFKKTPSSSTLENDLTTLKTASSDLKTFVDRFANLDALESDLIFTGSQFETLKNVSNYFETISNSSKQNAEILEDIYLNFEKIDSLNNVATSVYIWDCDTEVLQSMTTNYISKAQEKCKKIEAEINSLNILSGVGDITHLQDMKNLVTSFKLACESAKSAVENEFFLLLEKRFKNLNNLYHFAPITVEDTTLKITKANYYLNDEELYYTQQQSALNFNTASYQVSLYDHSYTVMSIIGFLTILFGIFCTYRFFGSDRKNGKMDTILSRDVSFNQVFVGKTLAVVMISSTILFGFLLLSLIWGAIAYPSLSGSILAVFNLNNVYTIHPFLFLLLKVIGIQLQVIFYSTLTLFLMNISRKFRLMLAISVSIFAISTICNIFLNGSLVYCLFPFIHADITSFLGGATMQTGFLKTSLYASGNFFISLAYYLVVVVLLYSFTKQLFKKN